MKYLTATLLLIFWMIATIVLVITIIGIVIFIDDENAWMEIPKKLLTVFDESNQ